MALTQTREQMRDALRELTNTKGATALLRHPSASLDDYLCRGLSRLRFLLNQANPDQRFLASESDDTVDGTSLYSLPADFGFLISADVVANGAKTWLTSYEMHERAALTSADQPASGIPFCYRLRGGNIDFQPTPGGAYTYTLWYVPHTTEFTSDASVLDTINRLDDYVIAYAGKWVGTKDKNWDLVAECRTTMAELTSEIEVIGRSRDQNSMARITDVYLADRWGRRRRA